MTPPSNLVITNLSTYLAIAQDSLSESQTIGAAQRRPRPGGGEVITLDPDQRSFKLSLIAIAFAGMYLDALLYLYGCKKLGAAAYAKIDFDGYEKKLECFGIVDQALLDAAKEFRQARKELVHEKAHEQTELRVAQDEAQKGVDLIHRVRLALPPLSSAK